MVYPYIVDFIVRLPQEGPGVPAQPAYLLVVYQCTRTHLPPAAGRARCAIPTCLFAHNISVWQRALRAVSGEPDAPGAHLLRLAGRAAPSALGLGFRV